MAAEEEPPVAEAPPAETPAPETPAEEPGLIDAAIDAVVPDIELPGIPGVGDLASGISEGLLDGFFTMVGEALVSAATRVNELVFGSLNSTTTVDLNSLRGGGLLAMTTSIGVAMVLAFFFASIIRGLLRGEYSAITRAALVDVPLALVGTIGLVTFAQILLSITDAATGALLDNAAADLGESTLGVMSSPEAVVTGGLLSGFILIVYIIAALLTWLWLFLRAALIYFVIVAAPLGLATRAFPPAAVFARRTIEMAVALIVSKFFLAIALSLGASQFNATATGEADISTMLIGAGTMMLAAFMPSVVLKLIPIAEGATASAGVERAPLRMAAAAGGIAVAASAAGAAGAAGAGASAGGSGGAAGSSSPPAPGGSGGGGSTGAPGSGGGSGSPGSSGGEQAGGAGGAGGAGTPGSSGGPGSSGSSGSSGAPGVDGADGVSVESIGGGGVATVSGAGPRPEPTGSFADL